MPDTSSTLLKFQRAISVVHSPLTGWIVLALSLVLTMGAYIYAKNQVYDRAHERFQFRAKEIGQAIADRLGLYEQALISGVGLFAASESVEREEWYRFVASLQLEQRLPGIQGMGFAVPINPNQLQAHIESIRAEGFSDFTISPPGERDFYTSIIYLEPFDWRNKRAFGYDMWSNPMRRQAMSNATDTGLPTTSGIITLVQETETDVQKGFLTYVPVYKTHNLPSTIEQRRTNLIGWVYAAFRVKDLMTGILGATDTDISFEIFDDLKPSVDTLLFDSDHELSLQTKNYAPLFSTQQTLNLQGRNWTVIYSAPEDLLKNSAGADHPMYILVGGVLVDILLFYVILSLYFLNVHRRRSADELRLEFEKNQANLAHQTKLIEAAERESETFFELAPEAFLVIDENGKIVKANRHAHQLFEYQQGELVGTQVKTLLPLELSKNQYEQKSSVKQNINSSLSSQEPSSFAHKKSGELFPAVVSLAPIEYMGVSHLVAAISDISIQKRIELSLAKAKESAEAASRSKSEFVANMSHEIRTPLNAVLGAAQLLDKTEPNPDQQKYIKMIRLSGEALLGVINDILDFSKIEAGAMELTATTFDLNEILSRIAIMMSVNAGEKHLELVILVEPGVGPKFIGDPLRLQQVLINLSSNAIKFTEKGEVILHIKKAEDSEKLHFSVTDTGIGMTADEQSKLFKAFTQADESISRKYGGTGLGLVISNRIIEMMGGKIQLQSSPGEGSKFYFEVPLTQVTTPEETPEFLQHKTRHVLILDNNKWSTKAISAVLQQWQWQLTSFSCWQDALNKLTQNALIKTFDFVVIDPKFAPEGADAILQQLLTLGLPPQCGAVMTPANNQQTELLMGNSKSLFHAQCVKPIFASNLLDALQEASLNATGTGVTHATHEKMNESGKLHGIQLLLVEDNPFNRTIACGMLEDMGTQTSIAQHGAEAIELIKQKPELYDIVLMDIQMPVMDGVTATKILRNELGWTKPIIALTAGVLNSERAQYLAVGMNDLVPKPIDSNDLFRAINGCLYSYQSEQAELPSPSQNLDETSIDSSKPHFDIARIEALCNNKPKRIRKIIDTILAIEVEWPKDLQIVKGAIAEEDMETVRQTLHNLKGVIANYGGAALAEALQNAEHAALSNASDLNRAIEIAEARFHDYCKAAHAWIATQNTDAI